MASSVAICRAHRGTSLAATWHSNINERKQSYWKNTIRNNVLRNWSPGKSHTDHERLTAAIVNVILGVLDHLEWTNGILRAAFPVDPSSVHTIQFQNRWTDLDEIWYGLCHLSGLKWYSITGRSPLGEAKHNTSGDSGGVRLGVRLCGSRHVQLTHCGEQTSHSTTSGTKP
jgi:hypothetical protein